MACLEGAQHATLITIVWFTSVIEVSLFLFADACVWCGRGTRDTCSSTSSPSSVRMRYPSLYILFILLGYKKGVKRETDRRLHPEQSGSPFSSSIGDLKWGTITV